MFLDSGVMDWKTNQNPLNDEQPESKTCNATLLIYI